MIYNIFESEHYTFHYPAGSKATEDIAILAASQEACFCHITEVLKTKPSFKIHYWLCSTPEAVGQIYGDNEPCNGFACEPDRIYAVYNEEVQCVGPHEDAHLISYLLSVPNSGFLREGLAMFFDKTWWNRPNDEWTAAFLEGGTLPPLASLLQDDFFYSQDCSLTYPIAGSFTKYLMERFGMDSYLRFYRYSGTDWDAAMQTFFGCSLDGLEDAFRNSFE